VGPNFPCGRPHVADPIHMHPPEPDPPPPPRAALISQSLLVHSHCLRVTKYITGQGPHHLFTLSCYFVLIAVFGRCATDVCKLSCAVHCIEGRITTDGIQAVL